MNPNPKTAEDADARARIADTPGAVAGYASLEGGGGERRGGSAVRPLRTVRKTSIGRCWIDSTAAETTAVPCGVGRKDRNE